MKKGIKVALPLILSGLLVSHASLAGYPNKSTIAAHCSEVAHELNRLLKDNNPKDRCAGDVAVAAAYLSSAELKVNHEQYDEALVSLHYGDSELKGIAYSRAYCGHFASLVKPAIAKVIQIASELEVLERIKA